MRERIINVVIGTVMAILLPPAFASEIPQGPTMNPVRVLPCTLKVGRVVDGDTFYNRVTINVAPHYRVPREMRFRLKDVYSPERGEDRYGEFKSILKETIEGKKVALLIHEKDRDPRGGMIVTVYLCQPDGSREDVNEYMRAQGAVGFGKGVKK